MPRYTWREILPCLLISSICKSYCEIIGLLIIGTTVSIKFLLACNKFVIECSYQNDSLSSSSAKEQTSASGYCTAHREYEPCRKCDSSISFGVITLEVDWIWRQLSRSTNFSSIFSSMSLQKNTSAIKNKKIARN